MDIPDPLFLDSFLFNGEEIVKLRLAYLSPYVDRFYITESIYTFSGKKKDGFFVDKCASWFAPYAHKIRILKIYERLSEITEGYPTGDAKIDTLLSMYDSFKEEAAQRNYARKVLLEEYPSSQKYILAVSDVDEIYDLRTLGSKKIIWQACEEHIFFFKQKAYMFNFLYQQKDDICVGFLINSEMLQKHGDLNKIRNEKFGEKSIVFDSGWHFSFFMNSQEIQRKLHSYSHVDNNKPEFNNMNHIDEMISKGEDLFQRSKYPLTKVSYSDPSNKFPEIFQLFFLELCKVQGLHRI